MTSAGPDAAELSDEDVDLLIEALDSHEYWQLSDPSWRNSGAVILPGDAPLLWADRSEPTDEERAEMVETERCRSLAERLRQRLQR